MNEKKTPKRAPVPGSGVKGTKVLIKPDGRWYENIPESDADGNLQISVSEDEKHMTREEIATIQSRAEKLLDKDTQSYKSENMRGTQRADFLWMEKIMRTGTLPDKMAAFTVKIQDSPVHNLSCLQQLIGMVKIQGKQQCLMTADTTRDLFLEDLLPKNRKLVAFEHRGTRLRTASSKQLLLWIFEDRLKAQYRSFIEALRRMASDTIDKLRGKAISVIHQLLTTHPEQENILLPLLVNKLGDPVKKVGSRALFHLNKLLDQHPPMKVIVVQEVERLLFRSNIGKRPQYYGICFLNGIRVLGDESVLAIKLVKVYLAFFKACIKTGEIDSKMMSGLLSGVNKAFPVAKMDGYEFTESLDTLYKIVQLSQFNIGVQALALLFQVTDVRKHPQQADRYYRVLYKKLLSPEVATTSHSMQFLNVVFKSMKMDNVHNRVIGFSKRLLQLCNYMPPNLACAILFLISEVSKTHKDIILLGSVPLETNNTISESDGYTPTVETSKKKKKSKKTVQIDVDSLLKSTNMKFDFPEVVEESPTTPQSDLVSNENANDDAVVEIKDEKYKPLKEYDSSARNPTYSGAELTLSYELSCLLHHFHPSVALFSQTLLSRQFIQYDGNPLKDFTVGRFLERFVYRNAKQKRVHQEYQPQGLRNVPVNSTPYLQSEETKIPVEERFFYKYFKNQKLVQRKKDEKEEESSDVESVDDEEFDQFMDNYFKSNKASEDSNDEEEEEDVDFVSEMKKKSKGKKRKVEEVESEEDDEEEAIDFDGDYDADELIDLDEVGDEAEDDDLDGAGNFEDEDFEEFGGKAFKEKLKLKTQKKKFKAMKGDDMFAPAEKFSEMLETNADVAFTGSNTLINKDNSNVKQLKWESDRDRWVKGYKNSAKTKFSRKKENKRKFK